MNIKDYLKKIAPSGKIFQKKIKIKKAGEYSEGNYILQKDINVASGNGLIFNGDATLDLNGKRISGGNQINEWNYGILAHGRIEVHSKKIGEIFGFRVGIKITGKNSSVMNTRFHKNRYIGIMIEADDALLKDCEFEQIGGVNDEPYAIAVQIGESSRTKIIGSIIKNIYKQASYMGAAAGEGLGINLSANSIDCQVKNCRIENDMPTNGTIGIFCGVRGGHEVSGNKISNFYGGVCSDEDALSTIENNEIEISKKNVGSYGIFGQRCKLIENKISENFQTKILIEKYSNPTL